MKKILGLLLIFCLMSEIPVSADVWHGHAEKTDEYGKIKEEKIFTGKTDKIENKEVVKMVVSQVLQGGTTMEGDEFFAEVSSDVEGEGGVLLPVGTLAHGTVRNIIGGKRGGRDGWIEVKFDSLITPDGREIPINASMTTKNSAPKAIAKAIGVDTAYTVTGSLVGGVTALNLLGLEAAIASHGYTLLGGVAAGAVMGHEQEHVAHARAEGSQENKELVSVSVTLHTSVCPECGRVYVSGGETNTTMRTTSGDDKKNDAAKQMMNGYKGVQNPYEREMNKQLAMHGAGLNFSAGA